MKRKQPSNKYPYITSDPHILNGVPIIAGTRIAVRCIAGYYQMGLSVDEILLNLSHLTPSQVHSALAYYFDHQAAIDKDLAEASDVEHWKGYAQEQEKKYGIA
jgi:uncharacterized protein (DUF433 family)